MHTLPEGAPAATPHSPETSPDWMARGAQLHGAGQLEQALLAFEKALALTPGDVNAASACATLLAALSRPQASYKTLLSVKAALLKTADGAANLAIAAENCGDLAGAQNAYQRALDLDPHHLRALNNIGLMAAIQSRWDTAIECARKCLAQDTTHVPYHVNLCDYLCGAKRYSEALTVLKTAVSHFPDDPEIKVRCASVLAFNGDFEASHETMLAFDSSTSDHFRHFLGRAIAPSFFDNKPRLQPDGLPDARQLYTAQAFEAMFVCDWRDNDRLVATIRHMLTESMRTGQDPGCRDAQFFGLLLGMDENEMAQWCNTPVSGSRTILTPALPPFVHRPKPGTRHDGRLHIGMALQNLRDESYVHALKRQLALHDARRFAIHLYASTPQPDPHHGDMLRPYTASLTEIAHMSDIEATGRIRLDTLDLFIDMTFGTAFCRPDILEMRVAPVQVRQLTWHRHNPPRPCDYNMSDTFVHPDGLDLSAYGAIVRLPYTCWLATHGETPEDSWHSRGQAGLPDDALVLCATAPPLMLDPHSFGTWMKILRSLPDAVLWLPGGYNLLTAGNLVREANAAGVNENRLLFAHRLPRRQSLARMKHADLFLDTLRFSANQDLEDALRQGIPAITCAGDSMASRLGGSMLRATNLPECVTENQPAYVAEVLRLGRNPQALQQLKQRLREGKDQAPLFNLAERVREWEAAWLTMAERSRAGLPPAAFDVEPFTSTSGAGMLSIQ